MRAPAAPWSVCTATFADGLGLDDVVLVVNDWGGPIALPWAIANPGRVAGIVLMNTWCWATDGDWYYELFSRGFGGPLGRLLIRHGNVFTRLLMPILVRNPAARTPAIRGHLAGPGAAGRPRPAAGEPGS